MIPYTRTSLSEICRRRRWLIGAVWIAITIVGAYLSWRSPNVYQSTGKLFVRLGRENVTLDPTANLGQGSISAVPQLREQEINTIVETLKSRVLYGQVVDSLTPARILLGCGPAFDWLSTSSESRREDAIERVAGTCEVIAFRKSNLIGISCEAHDPVLAKEIADKLIDRFFDYHRSLNRNPGAGKFFLQQAEFLCDQLRQKEAEMLQLKNTIGVVSVEQQKRLTLDRANSLDNDLQTTEASVRQTAAAIGVLEAQLNTLPEQLTIERSEGNATSPADTIRDRVFSLEVQESELAARMTDEHFLLRQTREQLAVAKKIQQSEKALRLEMKGGRNRAYEQTESSLLAKQSELAALRARVLAIKGSRDSLSDELLALNNAESKLSQLQRELELSRENYDKYCHSLEQTRIDEALEAGRISNISVAEPPTASRRSIRPNRALILALSTIAGLIVALAAALIAEHIGWQKVSTAGLARVRQTPMPTLV